MGFVSLIVFPLFGLLSTLKLKRSISPYLAGLTAAWGIIGVLVFGGGATPMGPGDRVTPEQARAWFETPWVREGMAIWGIGLAIGVGLLVSVMLIERLLTSPIVQKAWKVFKIWLFAAGAFSFFKLYVFRS